MLKIKTGSKNQKPDRIENLELNEIYGHETRFLGF